MWPFRPSQIVPDRPDRHAMTLDLIEQVAALRGQVRAIEVEWDAVRVQIQKGWQRVEKANERSERRTTMESDPPPEQDPPGREGEGTHLQHGFAAKLQEMRER